MPLNLLGTKIDPQHFSEAIEKFYTLAPKPGFICHLNVHTIMTACFSETYRQALNAAQMATTDGMPLVWFSKFKGVKTERVYGPDFMQAVLSQDKKFKHFLLGSKPEVLKKVQQNFSQQNPSLQWAGSYAPPFMPQFDEAENQKIISLIQNSGADVVWVGLGAPKQELWAAQHQSKIQALIVANGAAFAFHGGDLAQAPSWMQKMGLEWLFRLLKEPRRLWKRYLYNPLFVILVLLQVLGILKPKSIEVKGL